MAARRALASKSSAIYGFSADFGKRGMEENPTFLTLSAFLPLKRLEALRAL